MMSFSTISAEPLTLQQFVFFQDELEDGLALHIHLQEREITSERRKENNIFHCTEQLLQTDMGDRRDQRDWDRNGN